MSALWHVWQFLVALVEWVGRVVTWMAIALAGVFALFFILAAFQAWVFPSYAIVVYAKGDMVVPEWYWDYTQCQQDSLLKYPSGACVDTTEDRWTFVERYR